jgi:hypothetical protein
LAVRELLCATEGLTRPSRQSHKGLFIIGGESRKGKKETKGKQLQERSRRKKKNKRTPFPTLLDIEKDKQKERKDGEDNNRNKKRTIERRKSEAR